MAPNEPTRNPAPPEPESLYPDVRPQPSGPEDVPADEADFSGNEPAHLVALPPPAPGDPEQVIVPETRAPRPEDELPKPLPGATSVNSSAASDEFLNRIMPLAMNEANIFSLCYDAARTVVQHQMPNEMRDSAAIGEAMFQPGSRTPLETAVPQIAIEIYRNVRDEMKHPPKAKKTGKKNP
jgi:hypothetical protein